MVNHLATIDASELAQPRRDARIIPVGERNNVLGVRARSSGCPLGGVTLQRGMGIRERYTAPAAMVMEGGFAAGLL